MFVEGFAAYLKHDARRDFVVDLDGSREWLGFSSKGNAKKAVVKHLKEGTHNTASLIQLDKRDGGQNKEQVLLTVHGFKQLCMVANTDKARKVRDYYIAMEEVTRVAVIAGLLEQGHRQEGGGQEGAAVVMMAAASPST